MSYEDGRKLTNLGFGLNLIVNIVFVLDLVVSNVFHLSTNVINTLLNCGQYLSIGVAALGFLLMWLSDKEMIDLLSCGTTGIAAFLGLLNSVGIINTGNQFGSIIVSAILSAFYIVLALRAKDFNILISLLLVCAFIYQVFSGVFFVNFLYARIGLPFFLIFLVWFVGYAVCAGICFVEVKMED